MRRLVFIAALVFISGCGIGAAGGLALLGAGHNYACPSKNCQALKYDMFLAPLASFGKVR